MDALSAYHELCAWLGEQCEMIAAVALGYPDDWPDASPRRPVSEVAHWL